MSSQSGLPLFLGQLIRSPRNISAIAPSSMALARQMAAELPTNRTGPVVEFGPGTGKITQALLEAGVAAQDLHAFELNEEFVQLLRRSFSDIHVHHKPAQDLGTLGLGQVRAVVSGLPLLSIPGEIQHEILGAAFRAMGAGGVYIQFTYGPKSPLDEQVAQELALTYTKSRRIWGNLPPATVYSFRSNMV